MRSLIRRKSHPARHDPAPSRWSWRMQRLMLTPGFRLTLRAGVPFCLTLLAGTLYLADPQRRAAISQSVAEARTSFEERPEFMVKLMAIDGADDVVSSEIRSAVMIEFPQSSFDLDLEALRAKIIGLDGVKNASVRIKPGGILQIDVTRRIPVALWRNADGLALIDEEGVSVALAESRSDHPHLPLVVGTGADRHVAEALDLLETASMLESRVRGIVRMGERRWDVVLNRNQRIMLPETDATRALERVIALEGAREVLTRDVLRVDMRIAARPTIRMTEHATSEWRAIKEVQTQ